MKGTQKELSAIDELVLTQSSRQMYKEGRETLQERSICVYKYIIIIIINSSVWKLKIYVNLE